MVHADLAWLQEVGRRLIKAQSRPEILAVAYHGIRDRQGYDRAAISLFDREAGVFERCIRTNPQGGVFCPGNRIAGLSRADALWRLPSLAALLRGEAAYHTFDAAGECPAGLHYL